ncbi:MAG: hypothetical protein JWO46_3372 [Nocardioidaceae bacterium]|nr:hypothetical protein [Nocardioidaceae bacterium]
MARVLIRTTRLSAVVAVFALATGAPALTAPASAAPSDGVDTTSVTVVLKAPDARALRALATNKSLSPKTKLARLADLVPSTDTGNDVAAQLRDHGLTVTDSTSWTITASGSAAGIRSLFGDTPASTSTPLAVPSFLSDDVAVALASTGAPRFKSRAAPDPRSGADVRNANAAAGSTPPSGTDASGFTIATVQFATWDDANLTKYATQVLGVADPVGSGQYTPVDVSGGTTTTDGEDEVALDQESILATSPTVQQRAYFAPNSDAGFIALVSQVSDDATSFHISALSSSWGACETSWDPATRASMDNVFATLASKGVTTFSASGDSGAYDCVNYDEDGNSVSYLPDVDYPASSPYVVGVGGTNLTSPDRTANTGANWIEKAWSCTGPESCIIDDGGSGGGASTAYGQPSWQSTHLTGIYQSSKRLVPDIASVGDYRTGFAIYHGTVNSGQALDTFGGTSLATPLSAALLTNALAQTGKTTGAGEIHEALYSAYDNTWCRSATAPTTAVRDVTIGSNGSNATKDPDDPSTDAASGYDTVTGIGAVLWNALVPYLDPATRPASDPCRLAPAPAPAPATPVPSAAISVVKVKKHRHPAKRSVVARWSVANPSARGETITVVDATTHKTLATSTSPQGSLTFKVKKKHTVTITVTAYDAAGGAHPASASVRTPKR